MRRYFDDFYEWNRFVKARTSEWERKSKGAKRWRLKVVALRAGMG